VKITLARRIAAEFLGTLFLLAAQHLKRAAPSLVVPPDPRMSAPLPRPFDLSLGNTFGDVPPYVASDGVRVSRQGLKPRSSMRLSRPG
jgi:hypothetical protein